MTEYVKADIKSRYFDEYLEGVAQESGSWAKLALSPKKSFTFLGGFVLATMASTALILVAPPVGLALTFVSATTGVGVATFCQHAATRMANTTHKKIAKDINNGQLLARYKNDLVAEENRKLSAATKVLSALEGASTLDDFQNVAAKRAELVNESVAKPAAPSLSKPRT